MLSLDSLEWDNLEHAYGSASDIPELLRQLNSLPSSHGNVEPWFSIWSALAHQGDVYSASFAAVPHVVKVLSTNVALASADYFQFPAWVEICRHRKNVPIPVHLSQAYLEALAQLPQLIGAAASRQWDAEFLAVAMSALAAAKGYTTVAEAALELRPDVAVGFLEWFGSK